MDRDKAREIALMAAVRMNSGSPNVSTPSTTVSAAMQLEKYLLGIHPLQTGR